MLTPPSEPYLYHMLINGQWVEAASGQRYQRESPAHDVAVGDYPLADVVDTDAAVAAARRAFDEGPWPHMPGAERGRILYRVAEAMRAAKDELAYIEVLESGKPISQAREEMEGAAALWDYAASLTRHIYGETYNTLGRDMLGLILREPVGVVGMITPWNFPLLIISQKLPFALAAGCTAVVKPSNLTSGTTLRLGKIVQEAGVPDGVVNIVTGSGASVGTRMAEHPDVDMISFTGSTGVGKQVLEASKGNLKRVALELGGKNPQIVFADADMEDDVDGVVFGVYDNAGECCNSGSRLLVQRSIADTFVNAVVEHARSVPVGDPLDEKTKVGAIVNAAQLNKIMSYIDAGQREGARLALGGEQIRSEHGSFVEPTIFAAVTPTMTIAREEIFGPVLAVVPFETAQEAIAIANDTMYGLSAGLWTSSVDTAFEVSRGIRAGTIWINTYLDGYPELSFGGYNQSGLGRELGRIAIEEFTELKTIQLHLGKRTNWWHRPGQRVSLT